MNPDEERALYLRKNSKILKGKESIKKYLDISEPLFNKFVRMGMPVKVFFGVYWGYTGNIEQFFQSITLVGGPQQPVSESPEPE